MVAIERERTRQREDRALQECLSKVGLPGAEFLVVLGPEGCGKTALLNKIAEELDTWVVLRARCLPLKYPMPLGVIHQWFAALVKSSAEGLAPFDGPGELLRDLVLRGPQKAEPSAISYSLRWVLSQLSAERRVLLIVDDFQWADAESAAVIGFGLSLLSPEPVALLVSLREPEYRSLDSEVISALLHVATVVSLRSTSLTPAEHKVATLAAGGLTNRDIATRLYITQKTVEFHLSKSFRKLGIAKRHELFEALKTVQARATGEQLSAAPDAARTWPENY